MNAQTRTIGSNTIDLDNLLELQLNALNTTPDVPEKSGPPGYLNVEIESIENSEPGSSSAYDLPFLNLDPYNLDDKDNLPNGELQEGPLGNIISEIQSSNGAGEQQLGFGLEMADYKFRTDEGTLDILTLSEERMTEIKTMNVNGQPNVPVEYQSGLAYHFEGNFYDTLFRQLYITMDAEAHTTIQREGFDANGNLMLTGYGYEQMLNVAGQAFDFGIEEFFMEFGFMVDLQRGEYGYEMIVSVFFEGEILYLNGAERQYHFEEDLPFRFSDLDEMGTVEFSQSLYDEIARFANGMGEAWDAFGTFNDHLEAVLLKLREDGQYQAWDEIGQGLQNPFDFNLPNTDPFA